SRAILWVPVGWRTIFCWEARTTDVPAQVGGLENTPRAAMLVKAPARSMRYGSRSGVAGSPSWSKIVETWMPLTLIFLKEPPSTAGLADQPWAPSGEVLLSVVRVR